MITAFQADDLCLHQRISELDCTSQGEVAACTVQSIDRDSGNYLSCIWTVALDGSSVAQLTRGPGLDRSPTWSPDGRTLASCPTVPAVRRRSTGSTSRAARRARSALSRSR